MNLKAEYFLKINEIWCLIKQQRENINKSNSTNKEISVQIKRIFFNEYIHACTKS